MPLIRGRWFSSAENGHRLFDAAFLLTGDVHHASLRLFHRFHNRRALTVASVPARTGMDPAVNTATLRLSANVPRNPSLRRNMGIGTAVVPTALNRGSSCSQPNLQGRYRYPATLSVMLILAWSWIGSPSFQLEPCRIENPQSS